MGFFSSSANPLLKIKANLIVEDLFKIFDGFDEDLKGYSPGLQIIDKERVKLNIISAGSFHLTTILADDRSISNRKFNKLIENIYIAGNSKNPGFEEEMKFCKEILKTNIGNIRDIREWKGTEQDLFNQIKLSIGFCVSIPISAELKLEKGRQFQALHFNWRVYYK